MNVEAKFSLSKTNKRLKLPATIPTNSDNGGLQALLEQTSSIMNM